MKNFFLVWTSLLLLATIACSDKNINIKTDNDILSNTTWTRQLFYDWGEHYGYESFEFLSSNKFSLSEFDLNGVRQRFLLMGEYVLEGTEIKCRYERTLNTPSYYPGQESILTLDLKTNTIIPNNNQKIAFVKQ